MVRKDDLKKSVADQAFARLLEAQPILHGFEYRTARISDHELHVHVFMKGAAYSRDFVVKVSEFA
jgi:hypothetical protein